MSESRRIRLAPILLEAGFVVLGVFLALVANEWRADANARERAASARAGVIEEIRNNRETVRQMRDYHAHLIDTLRTFPSDGPAPSPRVFHRGFANAATTLSTAWEAANATDAVSHMNFDDVLAFSALYAEQRRYEQVTQEIGSVIFGELFARGTFGVTERYRSLADLNGSLLYLEHALVSAYDSVLVHLDEPD
ncbi:MAG: hypothetical protein ABJF88_03850 [Rhodothermales bacterium]